MSRQITKMHLRNAVMASGHLSLVLFRTEWSGACHIIAPIFEDLARSYTGQADLFSIDAEQEAGVEREYGVQEFPTILFFRNGELIDHVIGLVPKNTLISKIEQALIQTPIVKIPLL